MNTRTTEYVSVKTPEAIEKCLKYAGEQSPSTHADRDALQSIIDSMEVNVIFTGVKKHFADDEQERLTGTFEIVRKNQRIRFDYGFSIRATQDLTADLLRSGWVNFGGERIYADYSNSKRLLLQQAGLVKKFQDGLLYSCLTSCRSEYYCPKSFSDFCGELGYDEDSRKAEALHRACLEQSAKLEKIFTEEEINFLPR